MYSESKMGMSEPCEFCGGPVNPFDQSTWKQVKGWIHGPKADSMTMREYTKKYAHTHCINKAKLGQAPSQIDLLNEEFDLEKESTATVIPKEITEMFDGR
jgi:hypothetical protein